MIIAKERVKCSVINSKKIGEEIVVVHNRNFERGVSKDKSKAIYSLEEIDLLNKAGLENDELKIINSAKKIFGGKVVE